MSLPVDDQRKAASLSGRELQIARAYSRGQEYRQIADELGIAPSTVRTHVTNIYRKLKVSNKIELLHELNDEQTVVAPVPRRAGLAAIGGVAVLVIVLAAMVLPSSEAEPVQEVPVAQNMALVPLHHSQTGAAGQAANLALNRDLATSLSAQRQVLVANPDAAGLNVPQSAYAEELARELGLSHVLFGKTEMRGTSLTATVSLFDMAQGAVIWQGSFERASSDVLGLRNEILAGIASAIEPKGTPSTSLNCRELRRHMPPNSADGDDPMAGAIAPENIVYCSTRNVGPR